MYQLIQLSDLECDLLNPHDASRNINAVVVSCAGETVACQMWLRMQLSSYDRLIEAALLRAPQLNVEALAASR
jgi:hypothetical protein